VSNIQSYACELEGAKPDRLKQESLISYAGYLAICEPWLNKKNYETVAGIPFLKLG
jgi:hypothetical protein